MLNVSRKKSGVKQLFHQLPRDDSLSLRSVSPPAGPKSAWFYVIREVGAPCRFCHTRSFLAVKLLYMCHLKHYLFRFLIRTTSMRRRIQVFAMCILHLQRELYMPMTRGITNFDSGRHEGRCFDCGVDQLLPMM
jgi:hypothetical protein